MKLADISIRQPVFATMVIGGLVVLGLISLARLELKLEPEIEFPFVVVMTELRGASPETVEREVTDLIEEELNAIEGVRNLSSTSSQGLSTIQVEFEIQYPVDIKLQEVRDKVALAHPRLPIDVEPPLVQKFDLSAVGFMTVALGGSLPLRDLSDFAEHEVKERLQRVAGVGGINILGGREREIRIWLDPLRLTGYGLSIEDVAAGLSRDHTPGFERDFAYRYLTFYTSELYERTNEGELILIDKPDDCDATVTREWITFEPRTDWKIGDETYKAGSLLASNYEAWKKGERDVDVLFTPTDTTSLAGFSATKNHFLLNVLDNVKNRLEVLTPTKQGWKRGPLKGVPAIGQVSASAVDFWESDAYWLMVSGYTTPSSLFHGVVDGPGPELLKQLPAFFDAEGMQVAQHSARSKDGTPIPYFLVTPKGAAGKPSPTLLYGYGGFEVSMLPGYSAVVGRAWLSRGGVYAVANIRGGGEFGPRWHQAALRDKRHRAYEDFAAVAEDLVKRGVTTRAQLGKVDCALRTSLARIPRTRAAPTVRGPNAAPPSRASPRRASSAPGFGVPGASRTGPG